MNIEELLAREGIRDTLARYNMAGDRLKVDEFAALFAEDAILESNDFRCETRQGIHDWFAGSFRPREGAARPARQPQFARHHLGTCLIELTGAETAKARTYWAVFTDIGPDHCGTYNDDFRKVDERWLIARRKIRTDWWATESYFTKESRRV